MSDGEEWKGEEDKPAYGFSSMFFTPMTEEEKAAHKARYDEQRAKGRLLAATLAPFREDAKCVKCGSPKSRTAYCDGMNTRGYCIEHAGDVEHLHRYCKRCGFTWYELPLDAG